MPAQNIWKRCLCILGSVIFVSSFNISASAQSNTPAPVGKEISIPTHLQDGQEFQISIQDLIAFGEQLFRANWTIQEGGGRPLTKGTGSPLSDPSDPLVFPRNFNRVSSPDMNSCFGCHNKPEVGGGGEFGTLVFVLGQRFDFATFDGNETISTKGARDELGRLVTLQSINNPRKTVAMHGSGFIEMLARQVTADLQAKRDATSPGTCRALVSTGINFGAICRRTDGSWDISQVQGLAAPSLTTTGPSDPPNLIIRPFHQAGAVISVRQFTNNAFNHHHGIQAEERFGLGVDADGDDFVNEVTRADVTASVIFQATLPVPGQVIPSDSTIQQAISDGEELFSKIGCANCHILSLPLRDPVFKEPNPFNPPGNLRPGDTLTLSVDLTSDQLPQPRLKSSRGVVLVPAFTDLKLHDITSGPGDPNREPLDMNQPAGSSGFFAGNSKFITRKLWGIANQHPFMHHGQFTTMREAVLAHSGEALASRTAFGKLNTSKQDAVIEFLKSLQIVPKGTKCLTVDENLQCRN